MNVSIITVNKKIKITYFSGLPSPEVRRLQGSRVRQTRCCAEEGNDFEKFRLSIPLSGFSK